MALLPGRGGEAERSDASFDPEAYLDSLEPIGWRLGLERMHRLTTVLGMPQHRFASIHVVGTNGKSSVTRMAAALLQAHGLRAGAYVSPHTGRWAERVLVGGREIEAPRFAAAVERTAEAAETVNRSLEEGEEVTQFEVATAAAFVALAAARVEVVVIEAGLGGRLDATNTIPSRLTALTSIGLDHTQWLGDSEEQIAAEKLAVLRDHTVLVLGQVSDEVAALAAQTAERRNARLIHAPTDPGPDLRLRAPGSFQRRNFALAATVAEAFLGSIDREQAAVVAQGIAVPGRLEQIGEDPSVFVDAAHNAEGAAALAEALAEIAADRTIVACLAILSDKDAAAMIAALAPALDRAVCTELDAAALAHRGQPNATSHSAKALARLCEQAGLAADAEPDFAAAVARARRLAAEAGDGLVVVAGSHYALAPARLEL